MLDVRGEGPACSILWRRLDAPGHDACRLRPAASGWRIDGSAVFRDQEAVARLEYRVECDPGWITRRGWVRGWLGDRFVEAAVERAGDGSWTLNRSAAPGLAHCVDLDLGFTPATNTLQIRRLALAKGQTADAPTAWLDLSGPVLAMLEQRYERRSGEAYWYEAPRFSYAALLKVEEESGFVLHYPGLWEAEL